MIVYEEVLRKFLKTYGTGLRDLTTEPRKPSISLAAFLLRKTLKAAVVIGFGVAVGVGIVGGKWRKWVEIAGKTQLAKAAKMSVEQVCRCLE